MSPLTMADGMNLSRVCGGDPAAAREAEAEAIFVPRMRG